MTPMTLTPNEKDRRLAELIRSAGGVFIAFSAGVDSTYLLKKAHDITDDVTAVTVSSAFVPTEELDAAVSFCKAEGIRHIVMEFDPLSDSRIAANPPDRCYICKYTLFSRIKALAKENGIHHVFDGTNADVDGADRPGMRALEELGIESPLREAGLTKADIRALSKELGLPTWDKPSLACLATRISGPLTAEALRMTEKAEQYIRSLGFIQIRVRMLGNTARIEVLPGDIQRLTEPGTSEKIYTYLRSLGYTKVSADLAGYGR